MAKVLTDGALEAGFERLADIAANARDDSDAIAAMRLITELAGVKTPEAEKIKVEAKLSLAPRPDGSRPKPMLAAIDVASEPRQLGSGAP